MARSWPLPATGQANGTCGKNRWWTVAKFRSWLTIYNRYGPRVVPRRDAPGIRSRNLPNRDAAYGLVQPEPQRRATHDAQRDVARGVGLVSRWQVAAHIAGRRRTSQGGHSGCCLSSPALMRKQQSRRITSNPDYDLFQGHFSPDGRWIVFEAVRDHTDAQCTIHTLRNACCRRTVDPHFGGRRALGRQASLVSRWKNNLLRFWPWRLLQRLGNPLRCESRESQWENHSV